MRIYNDLENFGLMYGQKDWIFFLGGYKQFREIAVGRSSHVDLQLTGKMIDDMRVRWNLVQDRGKIRAQIGKRQVRTGRVRELARYTLDIAWDTVSSEEVAWYVQNGRAPRQFAFWTEDEQRAIRDVLADYILRYEDHRLIEGNTGGRFQPVPF